jgi:DNA polymerase-3 subunit delta
MTPRSSKQAANEKPVSKSALVVVFGEDDLRVEQAARAVIAETFPAGVPEMGLEVVEGRCANSGEALRSLDRLFESLNTFGFFSREKLVWWKSTNLLADNVTARAAAVAERIGELVEFLKTSGLAEGTTLMVTAESVDARKTFYKYAEKAGRIVSFKDERQEQTQHQTQLFVDQQLQLLGVSAEPRAVSLLMVLTDGEFRTLRSELEKLAAYAGPGGCIQEDHVHLLASGRQGAVVWDLTGAFDRRDIGRVIRMLDQLEYQQEEAIGLLFALISHVRQLLFLRELLDMNVLQATSNPGSLSGQIARIPASVRAQLPAEKKWNPLMGNPYAIFHRMSGASRFKAAELREAMHVLLECNEKLVTSSGGGEFYWLENALLKILADRPTAVPA